MNLISCNSCGVVLDKSKLEFPWTFSREDGSIDDSKAGWNGRDYVPKTKCPVCNGEILEDNV